MVGKAAETAYWQSFEPWPHQHHDQRPLARQRLGRVKASGSAKEMVSCEEAIHYLKDCGLGKLNRDGDGVTCEALCK